MAALCQRFEDPLSNCKVRDRIKTVCQDHRGIAEYTEDWVRTSSSAVSMMG